jgi:hypothetical protein
MTESFAKLNLLNSKSLDDVKRFSLLESGGVDSIAWTTEYWGNEDIKCADKWTYEQFNYAINDFGFRGDSLSEEIDLAAFGCSFTFGTGLPKGMLWHTLLARELDMSVMNFGLPARSIQSIVDMFLIISKHIKIKNAVFLMPSLTRLQFAKTHPETKLINHLNTCVDYHSAINKIYGIDEGQIYRAVPDEEMYKICKNQIYVLEYIARERGVKVYLSSWEEETYNFIKQMNLESITVLPMWRSLSMDFANNDKARDMHHPGPAHHALWANKIKGYIQ